VVRCGLPLKEISRSPAPHHNPDQLICVARLSAEKGLPGLLTVFAKLTIERPELKLLLVGDGSEKHALEQQARELGISSQVEFLGRQSESETLRLIARSKVLVLPSFMEGLPIVLMEAMALGTAAVSSNVAGVPELIADGTNGLLFPASDWSRLEICVRRLLNDAGLIETLTRNAERTISCHFDVRQSAKQLVKLYSELGPSPFGSKPNLGSPSE
jgi:glycosyltransferase involved in cell wall biosynthesis